MNDENDLHKRHAVRKYQWWRIRGVFWMFAGVVVAASYAAFPFGPSLLVGLGVVVAGGVSIGLGTNALRRLQSETKDL